MVASLDLGHRRQICRANMEISVALPCQRVLDDDGVDGLRQAPVMLTIEEWYGPFDKPRTMLTERDSSGNFLRRFDISEMEWVEAKAEAFSLGPDLIGEPPALKAVD